MTIEIDTDLSTKQKYYEYDPAQGGNWWIKEEPTAPAWFQEELNELGGLEDGRRPRLRVAWAGTLMHDMTEKPRLKYQIVREINDGYYYLRSDGGTGVTKSMNLPGDAAIPWQFHPKVRRLELGRLRWVIERHITASELRKQGRFEHRKAPNGEVILRELPGDGIYQHYFWVERANGAYRDLDREVLTAVQAMYLYDISTSEAQKALDADEADARRQLISQNEAREVWEDLKRSKVR